MISAGGLKIAVWEWPGQDPPLLFAHATGFHGRCWDEIIRLLPGRHCLALDFHGHGRSSKPEPPYHWSRFGCDLAGVAQQMGLKNAVGIGHSMGGHSTVQAAALAPEAFAALLLIDPTIFPPARYREAPLDASFTLRRRAVWSSPREMFERFRDRPPFAGWRPRILRDYCEYGLLPSGGKYLLACPPRAEASIYAHSNLPETDLHSAIPHIRQPAVVMRSGTVRTPGVVDLGASPTDPDLAARLPCGRDVLLAGTSHYIPMEHPELVAEEIRRIAG